MSVEEMVVVLLVHGYACTEVLPLGRKDGW